MNIPFNKPFLVGTEKKYIDKVFSDNHLSGDGYFSKKCEQWLETFIGSERALITHSGTAALEMAAMCCDLQQGDEVIMPSYTFTSTANAFALRGIIPVFVDVRSDTLNIDETKIEPAITSKTKAIIVVHYAGVACEMDKIMSIASQHNLYVIEDAAQAILGLYKNKYLGTIGHLGCFSFHATKNIVSGEGGALLVNDKKFIIKAEIIRDKGTNRSQFLRGEIDKYSWKDLGSSYLPSEMVAALLLSQLESAKEITKKRKQIWEEYNYQFRRLTINGFSLPETPKYCEHNGHSYFLICEREPDRDKIINILREIGIQATSHYLPLHSSEFGKKRYQFSGNDAITTRVANSILRLPMWIGLQPHIKDIVLAVQNSFNSISDISK